MCSPQQVSGPAEALDLLESALDYLNGCDVASLPTAVQAELLRGLERAQSRHTAARSRALSAFAAQRGHEDDGQHSARAWLTWQARVTGGAAAAAVAWSRRLADHPVIGEALARGQISTSWARRLCDWSDRLPPEKRRGADQILSGAATGGAELADLAGLTEEICRRTAAPSTDADDGFDDRHLRLGVTLRGAGRAEGT